MKTADSTHAAISWNSTTPTSTPTRTSSRRSSRGCRRGCRCRCCGMPAYDVQCRRCSRTLSKPAGERNREVLMCLDDSGRRHEKRQNQRQSERERERESRRRRAYGNLHKTASTPNANTTRNRCQVARASPTVDACSTTMH